MAHALFEEPPDWAHVHEMVRSLIADCWRTRENDPDYVDEALSEAVVAAETIRYYSRDQVDATKATALSALTVVENAARQTGDAPAPWPVRWRT